MKSENCILNTEGSNRSNPLVSICCITYNHESYLRQTLDGFLMQKTTFPVEIVLAEDCSTDGTRKICEEYAAKYPEKIHYIHRDHNVGYNENEYEAMCAAKGKYIAYCEGDDYWTDSLKLQKQVDFLESHTDYSVCWHRCKHRNKDMQKEWDDACARIIPNGAEGVDINMDTFFAGWYTQPLTMVYRKDALDLSLYHSYKYFRDMQQMYYLLTKGKGYLFAFNGGVRHVHEGGLASMISHMKYCDVAIPMLKEFYYKTRNKWTKKLYMSSLEEGVQEYTSVNKCKALRCAIQYFLLTGRLGSLGRNAKIIFHN